MDLEKREEIVKYTGLVTGHWGKDEGGIYGARSGTLRNLVRREPMKREECWSLWRAMEVGLWRP